MRTEVEMGGTLAPPRLARAGQVLPCASGAIGAAGPGVRLSGLQTGREATSLAACDGGPGRLTTWQQSPCAPHVGLLSPFLFLQTWK